MSEIVLEFEEALSEVLRHAAATGQLRRQPAALPLGEALGRVLSEPIRAERDQPPFPRSTRDGYALQAADVARASAIRVLGCVRAGEAWRGAALRAGEAVEIMTGAPVPEGADAVLMVEHAENAVDGFLRAAAGRVLAPGENVVPRGAEARAGDEVVPTGRRIGPAEIALAASCGCARLHTFRKPEVAIVATGDELVELDESPEPWQIRNSNSYALTALVSAEGGVGRKLDIARDRREDLIERIAQSATSDLLILSGGVSMGKYDLVEQVLRELHAEFFFTGALIQPGKPVVFGRVPRIGAQPTNDWTYFFGLPGNPVSTEVSFHLFVAPMIRALSGKTDIAPQFVEARLAVDVKGGARVTRFLPAIVESDWTRVTVRLVPWQGSGDLAANARANGFVVLPSGTTHFAARESVRVLLR